MIKQLLASLLFQLTPPEGSSEATAEEQETSSKTVIIPVKLTELFGAFILKV